MSSTPGWYPQPDGTDRYYDGNDWTQHVRTPSAAGPTTARAAPQKKNRLWMWIALGVGALVVLCCCGGLAVGMGEEGDGVSSETTSTSEPTETEASNSDGASGTSSSSSGSSSKSTSSASPSPKKTSTSAEPSGADFKVTAGELIKEFEGNELAGDQKYKDKTVQVSGVVEKIDTDLFNEEEYLLNITDGGDFEFLSVTCHDMDNDTLSKLTVGNPITVIGDFDDGGDLGVDLTNCSVL